MNIFVNLFGSSVETFCLDSDVLSVRDVRQQLFNDVDCYFTKNGQYLLEGDTIRHNDVITLQARLKGGKGGFGSMLRAMGSQIEKTTNREACRDLSGRRMRDVNNEKKMGEWIKKKQEQEEERKKNRISKLERQLERPKHFFNDPSYEQSLEATFENVDDALKSGLVAHKRSLDQSKSKEDPLAKKSKSRWMGFDEDSSDSEDSEDDDIMTSQSNLTSRTVESARSSTEPSVTSQSTTEPSVTSQSSTEPSMTSQSSTEPSMTSQSTTEPSVTSQSTTEPTVTSQSTTEPSVTSQSTTEPSVTSQSSTEPTVTSQSTTEPSVTSQSTTEPSVTSQSTTEPSVTSQ